MPDPECVRQLGTLVPPKRVLADNLSKGAVKVPPRTVLPHYVDGPLLQKAAQFTLNAFEDVSRVGHQPGERSPAPDRTPAPPIRDGTRANGSTTGRADLPRKPGRAAERYRAPRRLGLLRSSVSCATKWHSGVARERPGLNGQSPPPPTDVLT
jgi:hypothetical protein